MSTGCVDMAGAPRRLRVGKLRTCRRVLCAFLVAVSHRQVGVPARASAGSKNEEILHVGQGHHIPHFIRNGRSRLRGEAKGVCGLWDARKPGTTE